MLRALVEQIGSHHIPSRFAQRNAVVGSTMHGIGGDQVGAAPGTCGDGGGQGRVFDDISGDDAARRVAQHDPATARIDTLAKDVAADHVPAVPLGVLNHDPVRIVDDVAGNGESVASLGQANRRLAAEVVVADDDVAGSDGVDPDA